MVDAEKLKKRLNSFPSSSPGIGGLNSREMMALPATRLCCRNSSAVEHSGVTGSWHRCKSYWLNYHTPPAPFSISALSWLHVKTFFALFCLFNQLWCWMYLCFLPQMLPCLNLGDYQPQEETKCSLIMCCDPCTFSPVDVYADNKKSGVKIISFHITKKVREGKS